MNPEELHAAFPLSWPTGRPRTPNTRRRSAKFTLNFGAARDELLEELRRLSARNIVISTNIPTRRDGIPYASAAQPDDPGVAVYFDRFHIGKGTRSYVIACDSYKRIEWNLRAVGVTVEALRTIQRHGATEMLEQAFTGFAALPPVREEHWSEVLGLDRGTASHADVRAAVRELAKTHHPDVGGDGERMAEINAACASALLELDTRARKAQ